MKHEFNLRLTSLRGVLALIVLTFHICQSTSLIDGRKTGLIWGGHDASPFWDAVRDAVGRYFNAPAAATVFFVLSGYVLFLSLDRMRSKGSNTSAGDFIVARLLRLWPPLLFMLPIFVILYFATGYSLPPTTTADFSVYNIVLNAIFVSGRINGIVWTLHVEVFAAVFVLATWMAYVRWGMGAIFGITFFAAALSFLYLPEVPLKTVGYPETIVTRHLYAFSAGMTIPFWLSVLQSRMQNLFWRISFTLGGIFLMLPHFDDKSIQLLCQVVGSVMVILAILLNSSPNSRSFLDIGIIRRLGRISFGFYLFHSIALIFIWAHPEWVGFLLGLGIPSVVVVLLLSAFSTLLIVPFALACYHLVEVPSMGLIHRFRQRSSATSPLAGRIQAAE